MRHFISLIITVFILSACATQIDQGYVNRMDSFIGKPEAFLIDRMGVPDKSYKIDNGPKLATYTRVTEREVRSPGGFGMSSCIGQYGKFGYGACADTSPTRIYTFFCDVTFTIDHGRIKGWRQAGNDCPRIE